VTFQNKSLKVIYKRC